MSKKAFSSIKIDKWIRDAPFVLSGRIIALGKNNLEGVEPNESMATVLVEDVVLAPRDLGDLVGKTITVYLQSTKGIKSGQYSTIFAKSWHYGKNIGVIEVGRTTLTADRIRGATIQERLRILDEEIKDRIRGAKLIVSGKVISTYRAEESKELPGMEEGLEWWKAEIWVKTVEKGRPPSSLYIYFPIGLDPHWAEIPKLYPGQEGIWFLRSISEIEKEEEEGRMDKENQRRRIRQEEQEERLMVYRQLDYHAISALPRIQALLHHASKNDSEEE